MSHLQNQTTSFKSHNARAKVAGLASCVVKLFSTDIIPSLVFGSFVSIVLSFNINQNTFAVACVYHPPVSCYDGFLEDFLALSGFLSSLGSNFLICGDSFLHLDVDCRDRFNFNDVLKCCNLVQGVTGPTHIQ